MEITAVNIEFEHENDLNLLIARFNKLFNMQQYDLAEMCYVIKKIDDWFREYPDIVLINRSNSIVYDKNKLFETLKISKSQRSKYCSCYLKFCESFAGETKIKEPFVSFCQSKLFEMLPYEVADLIKWINDGYITPNMTKKQIRDFLLSTDVEDSEEDSKDADNEVVDTNEDYFLVLKNNVMRRDFLDNFRTWGLWFEEKRLKLKYFRCRFGDKVLVAVLGKDSILSTSVIADCKVFYYMSPDNELLLTPLHVEDIMKDMANVKDNKVYLYGGVV